MHARLTTVNNRRRPQWPQTPKPKARGLDLTVTEHPRLNHLRGLADSGAYDAHRVLKRQARRLGIEQTLHELKRLLLDPRCPLCREVPSTRHRQVRARRMGNDQIPAVIDVAQHVALNVLTRRLGREQVTTDRVVATGRESITNAPAVLTGHQDVHASPHEPL